MHRRKENQLNEICVMENRFQPLVGTAHRVPRKKKFDRPDLQDASLNCTN